MPIAEQIVSQTISTKLLNSAPNRSPSKIVKMNQ